MKRRVELLDTSVLLEILGVPYESDNRDEVLRQLDERGKSGSTTLIVSVAAIVEAGDHVGRIGDGELRRTCASRLKTLISATLAPEWPWTFQPIEWDRELLASLLEPTDARIPELVDSLTRKYLEMGDLLIVGEFKRLRENLDSRAVDVDVWTRDESLRGVVDDLRRPVKRPR